MTAWSTGRMRYASKGGYPGWSRELSKRLNTESSVDNCCGLVTERGYNNFCLWAFTYQDATEMILCEHFSIF